ncbi:MAG: hypothetical protein U0791_23230 [Gemmataceae bacterium]
MAGDPLRPVRPGGHSPLVRDTRAVNAVLAAARDFQQRRRGAGGAEPLEAPLNATLVADMKYDGSSITTLAAHSVLAYGTPLIDPAVAGSRHDAQQAPAFVGATPTDANKPFAITLDPIKGQQLGRAAIAGLAVVQVDVVSTSHWRAKPIVGSSAKLRSCSSGGVPILAKDSGTGTKWAMVLLDFGDDSRSADCTGLVSSLKPGRCYRLTTDAGDGSCGCVPAGQSANLAYDSARKAHTSSTLLYGCPPGVFTALCPSPTGAPRKWNVTLAGFTGDAASWNGNYTLSYTTGETWTVTKNGLTLTATQIAAGNWQVVADDGTYLASWTAEGVTGCCSAITLSLGDDGGATGAPSTLTLTPASSCGKGPAYTPILDKCTTECMRNARLRWEPVAGSGARTILFDPPVCGVDASGNKYADFSTDDPLLCTGTEASGCGDNKFTVRVTCVCCEGWTEGYYCVYEPSLGTTHCIHLYGHDNSCAPAQVVILSGVQETPEQCSCAPIYGCCGGDPVYPPGFCYTMSGNGIHSGLNGMYFQSNLGGNYGTYWPMRVVGPFDGAPPLFQTGDDGGYRAFTVAIACGSGWTLGYSEGLGSSGGGALPDLCEGDYPYEGIEIPETSPGAGNGATIDSLSNSLSCLDSLDACFFALQGLRARVRRISFVGTWAESSEDFGELTPFVIGGDYISAFSTSLVGTGTQPFVINFRDGSWISNAMGPDVTFTQTGSMLRWSWNYAGNDIAIEVELPSAACLDDSASTPVTYKCINGACTAVYDGSGTSLAACQAVCGSSPPPPPPPPCCSTVVGKTAAVNIPNGPHAGTWGVYSSTGSPPVTWGNGTGGPTCALSLGLNGFLDDGANGGPTNLIIGLTQCITPCGFMFLNVFDTLSVCPTATNVIVKSVVCNLTEVVVTVDGSYFCSTSDVTITTTL